MFQDSNLNYAAIGYLDANADTQWVRVESLRDSFLAGSDRVLNARVQTENVATGEATRWRDSLFEFGNGVVVHNFWTTADLEPEQTYRFSVESTREGEEASSTAEVSLPEDFPAPTVTAIAIEDEDLSGPAVVVRVRGVDRLGALLVYYSLRAVNAPPAGPPVYRDVESGFSYLDDAARAPNGAYEVEVNWQGDIGRALPSGFRLDTLYSARVEVASVGEDWPDYMRPVGRPNAPLPPGGGASNVVGGTGYVGGAVTKTVAIPIVEQ